MISIVDLRKAFGANAVLKGNSLEVTQGEVLCIIGPSGSGKSTILRCINGLESYDAGAIRVDGRLVKAVCNVGGPFVHGRTFDLSAGTARTLGFSGVGIVKWRVVNGASSKHQPKRIKRKRTARDDQELLSFLGYDWMESSTHEGATIVIDSRTAGWVTLRNELPSLTVLHPRKMQEWHRLTDNGQLANVCRVYSLDDDTCYT